MENASKALIIAGAILLSILLISLGIMVYNQAKGTINEADLTTEEVQTFNTKFSTYFGTGISGTKMNGLVDAVAASNGNSGKTITVVVSAATGAGTAATSLVGSYSGANYPTFDRTMKGDVTATVYDSNGYISVITISNLK